MPFPFLAVAGLSLAGGQSALPFFGAGNQAKVEDTKITEGLRTFVQQVVAEIKAGQRECTWLQTALAELDQREADARNRIQRPQTLDNFVLTDQLPHLRASLQKRIGNRCPGGKKAGLLPGGVGGLLDSFSANGGKIAIGAAVGVGILALLWALVG